MKIYFLSIVLVILIFYLVQTNKTCENFYSYRVNPRQLFEKKLIQLVEKLKLKIQTKNHYHYTIKNSKNKEIDINFFKIEGVNDITPVNKFINTNMLVDNNIPIPKCNFFSRIKDENDVDLILQNLLLDFPIVIKPNSMIHSNAVFSNIMSSNELQQVLDQYIKANFSDSILVQKYIPGKKYRILCYQNKVISVIRLSTPYIKGDGKSTINDLIIKLNDTHQKFTPILVNKYCLKKKEYNVNTILPKNKVFVFNNVVSCKNCYKFSKIDTKKVHPDNLLIFSKINAILGWNLSSIDFISKDISVSFLKNDAKVIGVNPNPDISGYFIANHRYKLDYLDKILKLYFNLN